MKRILFSLFACLSLFACSSDDQKIDTDLKSYKLHFEVNAVNEIDNGLRSGAPIYSQEATQKVTRVTIYAFKSNGTDYLYEKMFNVSGWTLGTTSLVYDVAEADKLSAGDYKFLAVGQDATDNYTLLSPTASTKLEDMTASIGTSGDEYEIFAGVGISTVSENGARVTVNMTRKVAGVLGYFKNVPQILDTKTVKYLRLTISGTNKTVNLSTGLGSNSGTVSYKIINMDLAATQTVSNGYYVGNDLSSAGVVKLSNTQLSGAYLTPISDITMTLGLYDDLEAPIKTWTVLNGGSANFNIVANNFYSLGTKAEAGTTGTGGPTPDNPIDLAVDDEITITITPNWDIINNLTIQ